MKRKIKKIIGVNMAFLFLLIFIILIGQSQCVSIKITSNPITEATLNVGYSYVPTFELSPPPKGKEPKGLDCFLEEGPVGMSVEQKSGIVGWNPDTTGEFSVKFCCTYMKQDTDCQKYLLFVSRGININPRTSNPREGKEGPVNVEVISGINGQGIEKAFVMIGLQKDDPFEGNTGFTDSSGKITFQNVPAGPYTVTAGKPGFTLFSIYGTDAGNVTVAIKPIDEGKPDKFTVSGNLVGDVSAPSGYVYAGFVTSELNIIDVMTFDVNGVMAPYVPMSIYGIPVDVPGNVAIPKQSGVEQDYVIPVYPGQHSFSAVGGVVSQSELMNLISGGITDMTKFIVNLLKIMKVKNAGILKDLGVNKNLIDKDIPMKDALNPTMSVTISNTPSGLSITAAAMMRKPGTGFYPAEFFPTSFVILDQPGTTSLTTVPSDGAFLSTTYNAVASATDLSGASNKSTVILKHNVQRDAKLTFDDFLKPVDGMQWTGKRFSFNSPNNKDITPPSPEFGFSMSKLSLISLVPVDPNKPDGPKELVYTFLWDIYTNAKIPNESGGYDDLTTFTLPTLPAEEGVPKGLTSGLPYLWEILACAMTNIPEGKDPFNFDTFEFRSFIDSVTHCGGNAIARVAP